MSVINKEKIRILQQALLAKNQRLQIILYGQVGSGRSQFLSNLLSGLYTGELSPIADLSLMLNECCQIAYYTHVKAFEEQIVRGIKETFPLELQKYAQVKCQSIRKMPELLAQTKHDIVVLEDHRLEEPNLYQEIKTAQLMNPYPQHIIYKFCIKPPQQLILSSDILINLSLDDIFEKITLLNSDNDE